MYFQLKTSNDLEIYEIDYPSKDKLEEICDLRQPILFNFQNERILDSCQRQNILDTYGAFDVKIRKARVGRNPNRPETDVPIPARAMVKFKAGKEMRAEVLKLTPKA